MPVCVCRIILLCILVCLRNKVTQFANRDERVKIAICKRAALNFQRAAFGSRAALCPPLI